MPLAKTTQDYLQKHYRAFEIDKPHRHNQNLVGTFHGTSLLWSTKMKAAVILVLLKLKIWKLLKLFLRVMKEKLPFSKLEFRIYNS